MVVTSQICCTPRATRCSGRSAVRTTPNAPHCFPHTFLHPFEGDVVDAVSLTRVVHAAAPTEAYHLATLSHVGYSFANPTLTMAVTGQGTLNILEALRLTGRADRTAT